jgi:hypothetical protein
VLLAPWPSYLKRANLASYGSAAFLILKNGKVAPDFLKNPKYKLLRRDWFLIKKLKLKSSAYLPQSIQATNLFKADDYLNSMVNKVRKNYFFKMILTTSSCNQFSNEDAGHILIGRCSRCQYAAAAPIKNTHWNPYKSLAKGNYFVSFTCSSHLISFIY